MDQILFICSSVDGHLSAFGFWATMSNTAVNICIQVLEWTWVFISLGRYLGVEPLGHMTTLWVAF